MPLALILLLMVLKNARSVAVAGDDDAEPEPSDEDLYQRFAKGDHQAFRVLLERHGTGVYRHLARYLGDDDAAQDLTQDVFLQVITAAEDFQGLSSFRTFLYRIMLNAAKMCLRTRQRHPERRARPLDAPAGPGTDGPTLLETLEAPMPDTDHATLSGELADALEAGLARLPDEQREAFLLREVEDLTFAEMAAILGVTEECVRSRTRTAVKNLRASLAGFEGAS